MREIGAREPLVSSLRSRRRLWLPGCARGRRVLRTTVHSNTYPRRSQITPPGVGLREDTTMERVCPITWQRGEGEVVK